MKRVNIGVVLIILAFVGIIVYGIIEEKQKKKIEYMVMNL